MLLVFLLAAWLILRLLTNYLLFRSLTPDVNATVSMNYLRLLEQTVPIVLVSGRKRKEFCRLLESTASLAAHSKCAN